MGDTDLVPESGSCAASRSTYVGGSGVRLACGELVSRVRELGMPQPIDWTEAGRRLMSSGTALIGWLGEPFGVPVTSPGHRGTHRFLHGMQGARGSKPLSFT